MATDGVAAMDFLRRRGEFADAQRPDLIITDLNMPRMNGFEMLEEIRGDADLKAIPVVVMSGSALEENVLRAYGLQANCYVTKPSDLDGMVAAVRCIGTFWMQFAKLPPRSAVGSSEFTGFRP